METVGIYASRVGRDALSKIREDVWILPKHGGGRCLSNPNPISPKCPKFIQFTHIHSISKAQLVHMITIYGTQGSGAVQKHGLNQVRDFHMFCPKRVGLVLRCLKKHCNISQALPFPNFHFLVSPHLFHLFHRLSFLSASPHLGFPSTHLLHCPAWLTTYINLRNSVEKRTWVGKLLSLLFPFLSNRRYLGRC